MGALLAIHLSTAQLVIQDFYYYLIHAVTHQLHLICKDLLVNPYAILDITLLTIFAKVYFIDLKLKTV